MIKLVVMNSVFALTYGWTIDKVNHCSCKNYGFILDCLLSSVYGCERKDSTCQNVNCTAQTAERCIYFPHQCYLDKKHNPNNPCQPYNSCSDLIGNDDRECYNYNYLCAKQGETGPNCVEFTCSYYSVDNCPLTCFVDGEKCTDYPNCSNLKLNQCNIQGQCYHDETTCKWWECSNYLRAPDCMYVRAPDRRIQPCYWNEKEEICSNANGPEQLNSTQCHISTNGAYHWSSNKMDSGSCVSCFGMLLKVILAILLFV